MFRNRQTQNNFRLVNVIYFGKSFQYHAEKQYTSVLPAGRAFVLYVFFVICLGFLAIISKLIAI